MTQDDRGADDNATPGAENRRVLLALISVILIDLIGFGIIMPVLPFYADEFGASGFVLGLLFSTHAFFQAACAPLWGRLSDRIGRRPVLLTTIAGSAVALAALGFANTLATLFAVRVLSGVFAANISVATATISDVTEAEERTRWMGLVGASFGIGFLLGPLLAFVTLPWGTTAPMFVAAGLAALNFVYASFVLREPERRDDANGAPDGGLRPLSDPVVRGLFLANLAFAFGSTQLETMFPYFMKDRFAYEPREFAWLLVGLALVTALVQGGAIRPLSKRLGEPRMLVVGTILGALGLACVPWMPTVALLLVPLVVSAIGRSVAQPAMMSLASMAAADSARGAVMGTYQSAASLARVVGPAVAGLLYDWQGAAPFVAASLAMLVALAVGSRAAAELGISSAAPTPEAP